MKMMRLRTWKILPGRSGFSLVEMMMVVLLIGIVATIAAPPMFRYLQSSRLQTTADKMAADLQFARSLAIANGVILQFSTTEAGYILRNPSDGSVLRTENFDGGMQLAAAQNTFFFPWGMADATVFTISNSAGAHQINLLPTGIVEVQ